MKFFSRLKLHCPNWWGRNFLHWKDKTLTLCYGNGLSSETVVIFLIAHLAFNLNEAK
jgi:hypothetical protein